MLRQKRKHSQLQHKTRSLNTQNGKNYRQGKPIAAVMSDMWPVVATTFVISMLLSVGLLYGGVFFHLPIYRYFASNLVHGIHPLTLALLLSGALGLIAAGIVVGFYEPEEIGKKIHRSLALYPHLFRNKFFRNLGWVIMVAVLGGIIGALCSTGHLLWINLHGGMTLTSQAVMQIFIQHMLAGLIVGAGIALLRNAIAMPPKTARTRMQAAVDSSLSDDDLTEDKLNYFGSAITVLGWFSLFSLFGVAFSMLPITGLLPQLAFGGLGPHLSYAIITGLCGVVFVAGPIICMDFKGRGRWLEQLAAHLKYSAKSLFRLLLGGIGGAVGGLIISFSVFHMFGMPAVVEGPLLAQSSIAGLVFGCVVTLLFLNFLSLRKAECDANNNAEAQTFAMVSGASNHLRQSRRHLARAAANAKSNAKKRRKNAAKQRQQADKRDQQFGRKQSARLEAAALTAAAPPPHSRAGGYSHLNQFSDDSDADTNSHSGGSDSTLLS